MSHTPINPKSKAQMQELLLSLPLEDDTLLTMLNGLDKYSEEDAKKCFEAFEAAAQAYGEAQPTIRALLGEIQPAPQSP